MKNIVEIGTVCKCIKCFNQGFYTKFNENVCKCCFCNKELNTKNNSMKNNIIYCESCNMMFQTKDIHNDSHNIYNVNIIEIGRAHV